MKRILCFLLLILFVFSAAPIIGSMTRSSPLKILTNAYGEENRLKFGVFTAYTACPEETDDDPDTMASGNKVYIGAIACPRYIDFGTRVRVEGMGEYTCEDRMNRRYRHQNRFDILMIEKKQALQFGVRQLAYEIIEQ
ncbi:MAG: hypothetical protein ACOCWY_04850 [Thermodesulfobacteriota bacterium]